MNAPILPLREGGPDLPLQDEDFCDCARGTEAFRWYVIGFEAPVDLLGFCAACSRCTTKGIRLYSGWQEPQGHRVYLAFTPSTFGMLRREVTP